MSYRRWICTCLGLAVIGSAVAIAETPEKTSNETKVESVGHKEVPVVAPTEPGNNPCTEIYYVLYARF